MGSRIVKKKKPEGEDVIKVEKKKKEVQQKDSQELRGIVRIAGYDMKGHHSIRKALTHVQGIGNNLANAICQVIEREMKLPETTKVGVLTDEQVQQIENILYNLHRYEIPGYLFNFQREHYENDKPVNMHYIGNDLIFKVRTVIEDEKKHYTWKGFRFIHGQKVRGQRTRTTGRKGMTVGVIRKATLQKAGAAAQQQQSAQQQAKQTTQKK
ncbi:MAG: 30S ribosomal protein S13 [Candidatus Anstonellales archaeon]